jgi:hypothetical protein
VLGALACWHIVHSQRSVAWWERCLVWANVTALFMFGVLYVEANYAAAKTVERAYRERSKQAQCVLDYPVTRNLTCLEGLYTSPALLSERIIGLQARGLSLFDRKRQKVFLETAQFDSREAQWTTPDPDNSDQASEVFVQLIPSQVEMAVYLPSTATSIVLESQAYVDMSGMFTVPEASSNEVVLRLSVINGNQVTVVYEDVFDLSQGVVLKPVMIDLGEFKGKDIKLYFETEAQGNPDGGKVMWFSPAIVLKF